MYITPNWLAKIFASKSLFFKSTPSGIESSEGDFLWENINSIPKIDNGVLFSGLKWHVNNKEYAVKWLSKSNVKSVFQLNAAHWCQKRELELIALSNQLKSDTKSRYLRFNRYLRLIQTSKTFLKVWPASISPKWIAEDGLSAFNHLTEIASWNEADLSRIQLEYVQRQKQRFENFFNTVESNPLTSLQQESCIIDEENNLVLAGAGTGKTSTMVGRAGYLLKSGQAKPNEILMLAFGKDAAKEMNERIVERLYTADIKASTFHSLGMSIISEVEDAKPSLSKLAQDEKAKQYWVNKTFNELLNVPEYRSIVINYFEKHLYTEENPFDFNSEGEYFEYLKGNDIRTLKGELVKSFGELYIANWLFKMGIEYLYEPKYEVSTKSIDFREYQPDFYLPELGIYIEHWGYDIHNNTAPYVDREQYFDGIKWKRQIHTLNNTKLVETSYADQQQGKLLSNLEDKLLKLGVIFNPLPDEAVLETLREFGAINSFSKTLCDMLTLLKASWIDKEQVTARFKNKDNAKQLNAAIDVLMPIFDAYQQHLIDNDEIDFDDMIGLAIKYVSSGQYKPKFKYLMVDEFQDISEPRARLIKALKDAVENASLFCVGDDWQAIYRFTGSDVTLTTKFEDYFGKSAITKLDKTFRFNNSISDVASKFVIQNPSQLKKTLNTHKKVNTPAVSLFKSNDKDALEQILIAINNRVSEGEIKSVYLLARYGFSLPDKTKVSYLNYQFNKLDIKSVTFHSSKGMEADFVVLMGLQSGKHGFPSEKITHPLIDSLLPPEERFKHAEERRLMYVAITRAKDRTYLLCDMTTASEFIIELIDDEYSIEEDEFETSLSQELFKQIKCKKCHTGSLVPRTGKFGSFYSCTHYPLCNHVENGCGKCKGPMEQIEGFKRCLNPECEHQVPTCPNCGAELALRKSKYGQFWGCRNFRMHEQPSCTYKQNIK